MPVPLPAAVPEKAVNRATSRRTDPVNRQHTLGGPWQLETLAARQRRRIVRAGHRFHLCGEERTGEGPDADVRRERRRSNDDVSLAVAAPFV